ncbi:MAG: hypothetical protein ABEJ78_01005 [Haloferacaceae archaeon]
MSDSPAEVGATTDAAPVEWVRVPAPDPPIRARLPYVEAKLEHPTLDAARVGDGFFPSAIPYRFEGTARVFYWRPSLATDAPAVDRWRGVCATTAAVRPVVDDSLPFAFATPATDGVDVVVDGTVAGDTTTARVEGYDPPSVTLAALSPDRCAFETPVGEVSLSPGERRTVAFDAQTVHTESGERVETTPQFAVRFPGRRVLHHPAPGASARLFPSFGVDLSAAPNPLPVVRSDADVDLDHLASGLDAALDERPYAETVLWQAFAHSAFGPATETPTLAQFDDGRIALLDGGDA